MELSLSKHQPELCQAHSMLPGCYRTNGHHEVSGTSVFIIQTHSISRLVASGSILGLGPVIIFKLWLIILSLIYSFSKLLHPTPLPFFRKLNHFTYFTTYMELFQKLAFFSRLKHCTPQCSLTLPRLIFSSFGSSY